MVFKKLGSFGIELFRNSIAEELVLLKKLLLKNLFSNIKTLKRNNSFMVALWLELWFKKNCDKIN